MNLNPYEEYERTGREPTPGAKLFCSWCDCPIYLDDDFYAIGNETLCDHCIDDYLSDFKWQSRRCCADEIV